MTQVNKQAVAAAFGRAAAQLFAQHDELQRQSAQGLLAALGGNRFPQVLDAGCGPGSNSRYWRESGKPGLTAIDLSPAMLDEARQQQAAHHYLAGRYRGYPAGGRAVRSGLEPSGGAVVQQPAAGLARALSRGATGRKGGLYHPAGKLAAGAESGVAAAVDEQPHANRFLIGDDHVTQGCSRGLALSQPGADHHAEL